MKRSPLPRKRVGKPRRVAAKCSKLRCSRRPAVLELCRTHAMEALDTRVGNYVKARDQVCLSCWSAENPQWCHIISRGARYIRWDTTTGGVGNSVRLCARCHQNYTLKPWLWAVFVELHWPGLWTELVQVEAAGERSGASVDVGALLEQYREEAA